MATRSIPGSELKAECGLLERTVLSQQLASLDEVTPWKPGGASNPAKDAHGWLRFLTRLHRYHARGENRDATSQRHVRADSQVLQLLRSEPVPVSLVSHAVTETPVRVYAKSMDALMLIHGLDAQLAWMTAQRELLLEHPSAETLDALPHILSTISYTYQLLAWIVTHPGPEAPFAVEDDAPEPPEWIRGLEPWDLMTICDAHQQHLARMSALSVLISSNRAAEGKAGRPTWSVFFGSMALDQNTSAGQLMKHRALAELLASVQLRNFAQTPEEPA